MSVARDLPAFEAGTVWIVGAGPGDPGLLTRLAEHALAEADIVLHDALVTREILALASRRARRIPVGKRGGAPSADQRDIEAALVRHARSGARVLRLKGGDPFVFGRGGEEALALKDAGIPYRIVPGITAGIGGLAYAGIPVTHRGVASAVTLVTGTGAASGLSDPGLADIDWPALARRDASAVLYMALARFADIATRLIALGRDPATPVAAVFNATRPDQRVVETTLGGATLDLTRHRRTGPAVIALGEIARLGAALAWFTPDTAAADAEDVHPTLKAGAHP